MLTAVLPQAYDDTDYAHGVIAGRRLSYEDVLRMIRDNLTPQQIVTEIGDRAATYGLKLEV